MGPLLIGKKKIGIGCCFIVAEAGVNHNGDIDLAKRLIDVAVEAGADAVKFQTFHADDLIIGTAEKAEYQKIATSSGESQYEMIKSLELTDSEFQELFLYAHNKNIIFLSTPFDEKSVDFLDELGVPAFKIPSGELTNIILLKKIAEKRKPVILSTGMADLGEIKRAVEVLQKNGAGEIILLHCTTSYPAPINSVNLRAMETMRREFRLPVGYSDHTEGITIPIAAVAMGAQVIEKHFTLDRTLPGPDHGVSLEPCELKAMIRAIRDVERAFGDGIKRPVPEENSMKRVARRSIVAKADIQAGAVLKASDLAVKRPGTGIEPRYLDLLIHKKAKKPIARDQIITWTWSNESQDTLYQRDTGRLWSHALGFTQDSRSS